MIFNKYQDCQRNCLRKWGLKSYFLKTATIKNIFNWSDNCAEFNAPVAVITGKNGVGKSTLINAIHFVYLKQQGEIDCGILSSLQNYEIKLVNQRDQEIIIKNGELEKSDFDLPNIVDLTFNSKLYSFFKNSTSSERISYTSTLDQYYSSPLPGEFTSYLQELIEKKVKNAERILDEGDVEENEDATLESAEIGNLAVPEQTPREYYRITLENGKIYDSYTMGSGEFYINQFLWGINDTPPRSIVIIEELENYIHSGVQKKIIELIHKKAHEKGIQFILTSHSPTIIDHVARNSLLLVRLEHPNVKLMSNCPNWVAKDDLGTTIQNKKIICVEDEKAKSFLASLISFGCPYLSHQVEIINCKGDSNVVGIIRSTTLLNLSNFIGILDGDIDIEEYNEKHKGAKEKIPSCIMQFPGRDLPEVVVVKESENHLNDLSDHIHKPFEDVRTAVNSAMTITDTHEWVSSISRKLGENPDFLWEIMIKIWYKYNQSDAETFFKAFYKEFEMH